MKTGRSANRRRLRLEQQLRRPLAALHLQLLHQLLHQQVRTANLCRRPGSVAQPQPLLRTSAPRATAAQEWTRRWRGLAPARQTAASGQPRRRKHAASLQQSLQSCLHRGRGHVRQRAERASLQRRGCRPAGAVQGVHSRLVAQQTRKTQAAAAIASLPHSCRVHREHSLQRWRGCRRCNCLPEPAASASQPRLPAERARPQTRHTQIATGPAAAALGLGLQMTAWTPACPARMRMVRRCLSHYAKRRRRKNHQPMKRCAALALPCATVAARRRARAARNRGRAHQDQHLCVCHHQRQPLAHPSPRCDWSGAAPW